MVAGAALKAVMTDTLAERQMSVAGLAREADVQRGDIYKWWRGETRPSRNSLARVAKALNVDPGPMREALGEAPPPRNEPDPVVLAIEAGVARLEALLLPVAEGQEARIRALEAELEALRVRSGAEASRARHAPPRTGE